MILSHFYVSSRDDNIYMAFEYGYKSNDFIENIASLWKYDSITNSINFIIHDYSFIIMSDDKENVFVSVSDADGFVSEIQSKMLEFRITHKCVQIYRGYNEVHRYCYV